MPENQSLWQTLTTSLTPEMIALIIAAFVLGVIGLVCRVLVLARIFRESTGLGVVATLIGPVAYIHGWSRMKEWGIRNLMIVWTVVSVAGIAVLSWFVVDVVVVLNEALGKLMT